MSSNNTKQSSLNDFNDLNDNEDSNEWKTVGKKKSSKNITNKPCPKESSASSDSFRKPRPDTDNRSQDKFTIGPNNQYKKEYRPYQSNKSSKTSNFLTGTDNDLNANTNIQSHLAQENKADKIELVSNYFQITAQPFKVYQYDAQVSEIKSSVGKRDIKISTEIFKKIESVNMSPGTFLFCDFAKKLYSTVKLTLNNFEIMIKNNEYKINLSLVREINYDPSQTSIDQEVLTVFNLIYTQNFELRNGSYKINRSFFTNEKARKLDFGIEIWQGIFLSVRQVEIGLALNVDVEHKVFFTSNKLLDFLMNFYECKQNVNALNDELKKDKGRRFLEKYKGLQVLDSNGYLKKIFAFSENSYENKFKFAEQNDRLINIYDYFQEKYEIKLRYPHLPCVNVGKTCNIPIELLTIKVQAVNPNKLTLKQKEQLLEANSCSALTRMSTIKDLVSKSSFNSNPILAQFNIRTSLQPVEVEGRVLKAPDLEYGGNGFISSENIGNKGSWNGSRLNFVEPSSVDEWVAFVNYNTDTKKPESISEFCEKLTKRSRGIRMNKVSEIIDVSTIFSDALNEYQLLHEFRNYVNTLRKKYKKLSLIVFFVPDDESNETIYNVFKTLGDIELGFATQFVRYDEKFLIKTPNVLLKINGKLGGRNFLLSENNTSYDECLRNLYDDGLMIIGADVTHPSPGDFDDETGKAESIAAVTGSLDPECTFYSARLFTQRRCSKKRVEIINDLYTAVVSLLNEYSKNNKHSPKHIIYFRDGVSEGEFDQVLDFELNKIRQACLDFGGGFKPSVTFVIVQKRHNTFFGLKNAPNENRTSINAKPGTTVNTIIVTPGYLNYFQLTYAMEKGTSHPCHYTLLHDENNMDQHKINVLSNYLCHIYARSERSVSYPAPTYCAHLAAFRARSYIRKPLRLNSNSDEIQSEEIKLHQNVKDTMFYL